MAMRTPVRGIGGGNSMLETVQEGSLPSTPSASLALGIDSGKSPIDDRPEKIIENPAEDVFTKNGRTTESGSDSGGGKSDGKGASRSEKPMTTTSRSNSVNLTKPYTTLVSRGKSNEGSSKHMTVETETVISIPQVAVGGGAGGSARTEPSNVRVKPSMETIKPKKEKKKVVRKAPSLSSGAGKWLYALQFLFFFFSPPALYAFSLHF
jgi:hypothetical protein